MTLGTLFTADFLTEGLQGAPAWNGAQAPDAAAVEARFRAILAAARDPSKLNEAQTEERIFRPMLRALGWEGLFSVQENMETRGRINVPDYSYFLDRDAFASGDAARTPETKFPHAIAVGDAKAWNVDFEAANTGSRPGETAVGQTLRYLERAKIQSNRKVRWAILSNGRVWRLYYADARSALDGYFEADLAEILALPGAQLKLAPVTGETDATRRARLFKTFVLAFRREAFESDPELDGRTFHDFALAEGARWETKVRTNLSEVVFSEVFPGLIRGLAAADKQAPRPLTPAYLAELREAALTVLYRLLFALYAEDRDLLPAHDRKYGIYSLSVARDKIAERLDVGDELTKSAAISGTTARICFAPSMTATRASASPPITAACSPLIARLCSNGRCFPIGFSRRCWIGCHGRKKATGSSASIFAISACANSARSTKACSNSSLSSTRPRLAASQCAPTHSAARVRVPITLRTNSSASLSREPWDR
jgi:hypothetical protein